MSSTLSNILGIFLLAGIVIAYSTTYYYKKQNEKALAKLKEDEAYIKTLLDKIPVSGDVALDSYRRLTLDIQLRGLLEQQNLSELKKKEIEQSVVNAMITGNSINNQTINNYNK